MCFNSEKYPGQKLIVEAVQSIPAIPATPVPAASPSSGEIAGDINKKNKAAALRKGGMSTIKNVGGSPGLSSASLATPAVTGQKKTLGA